MRFSANSRHSRWAALALGIGSIGFAGGAHAAGLVAEILSYWSDIIFLSEQQIVMVTVAGLLAILISIPLGIWLSRPHMRNSAEFAMQALNVGQAVPKLALLAIAMSVMGIGVVPAIFGLWVATILPIARNTYEGFTAVPSHLIEAATGMGMTPGQIIWRVELPNALYVIFAGIRTALAITVGTAPLAFLIGGGGLGELIFTGIDLNQIGMMLAGAIPTAILAILADALVGGLQFWMVSKGVNPLR
jgi:osmoprotectant transport system permease protein